MDPTCSLADVTRVSFSDVLRGCYKGEFGVNPNKYGCNVQAGQLYCFCKGDKCNNKAVPSGSNVNFDDHDSWGAGKSYHW